MRLPGGYLRHPIAIRPENLVTALNDVAATLNPHL